MNNEETTTAEFDEALASLDTEINAAIKRSISHNERVEVSVDGSILDLTDAYKLVFRESTECDSTKKNATLEHVWGMKDGNAFHLVISIS